MNTKIKLVLNPEEDDLSSSNKESLTMCNDPLVEYDEFGLYIKAEGVDMLYPRERVISFSVKRVTP